MEEKSRFALDVSLSKAIKGFALILMVAHHCFGFPAWYIQGVNYSNVLILGVPLANWITNSTDLCVSLFAFLTGWAYFYNQKKTIRYSLGKIVSFLKYYWFVLFIIFIPAAVTLGKYVPTAKDILSEHVRGQDKPCELCLVCLLLYLHDGDAAVRDEAV